MPLDSQEYRYDTVKHPYTTWQRIQLWFRGVIDAITSIPDKDWDEWVLLKPGDKGYENAPWGCVVDSNAPRYTFEDGEWVRVDSNKEPKPINPDWHAP